MTRAFSIALVAVAGCVADVVPLRAGTDPAELLPDAGNLQAGDLSQPVQDFAGQVVDLTAAPGPDLALPPPRFADVMNDIGMLGCTGCHDGSIPMPITYAGVSGEAMSGASSLLLTKNLSGGQSHSGGHPFKSTSDAVYQRWLAWIDAGDPQ